MTHILRNKNLVELNVFSVNVGRSGCPGDILQEPKAFATVSVNKIPLWRMCKSALLPPQALALFLFGSRQTNKGLLYRVKGTTFLPLEVLAEAREFPVV